MIWKEIIIVIDTMAYLSLLFMVILAVSATTTTYNGIRVVKTCKSMLRDILELGKDIHNDISHINIGNIEETQGDWWNHRILLLKNVKAQDFKHSNSDFTLESCNMLPTGTLQAIARGSGFTWKVSFDWQFKFFSLNIGGKGTAEITSEYVEFIQNYLDGLPDTNMHVKWNVTKQDLGDVMLPMIHDWLRTMLFERMTPKLTLKLNMHTDPISKEIIKPYEEMSTKYPDGEIKIKNEFYRATEGVIAEISHAVLNYNSTIYSIGSTFKKSIPYPVNSSIKATDDTNYDYQLCYNPKIFGEQLGLMMKAGYFTIVVTEKLKDKAPASVGYYKSIIPDLGNRYSDNEKVEVVCHADNGKEIQYLNYTDPKHKRILVPAKCEFMVERAKELFLTMRAVYNVKYEVSETGEWITSKLIDPKVHSVDTIPIVDFQARFIVREVASIFSELIEGYMIPSEKGYHLGTVRADKYEFIGVDERKDDVCFMYKDIEN